MMQLTTDELKERVGKPGTQLVDVRPIDAYNGWALRNERRGGHIDTARSLPAKWAGYLDWPDAVRSANLRPDNFLVLYGYEKSETEIVAKRLLRAGFGKLAVYHDFVREWAENEDLPVSRLQRFRQLVHARWLQALLRGDHVPEYRNDQYVICHAHYRNRPDYDKGHIPGAVDLDTNLLESPETWNRRSPAELSKALKELGITTKTTVILYGRSSSPKPDDPFPGSSAGQLAAMRCAFIMLYAGVNDVRVLNGGLQSWIDEGFQVSTEETPKKAVSDTGVPLSLRPELALDLPEAKEILRKDDANLVCVRSWPEYTGEVSGYNYISKKGRIPGAVFSRCGSDAYHMEGFRNFDDTGREYHEIESSWKQAGITPDKHNAFYCGTGWRGSEAFFNAWLMGWPRISVFDGGWFEWSSDENNPIETGTPEELQGAGEAAA